MPRNSADLAFFSLLVEMGVAKMESPGSATVAIMGGGGGGGSVVYVCIGLTSCMKGACSTAF